MVKAMLYVYTERDYPLAENSKFFFRLGIPRFKYYFFSNNCRTLTKYYNFKNMFSYMWRDNYLYL